MNKLKHPTMNLMFKKSKRLSLKVLIIKRKNSIKKQSKLKLELKRLHLRKLSMHLMNLFKFLWSSKNKRTKFEMIMESKKTRKLII